MSRRFLAGAAALACALIGLGVATGPAADRTGATGKDIFGTTKLWAFHLEIPAKEYEAMLIREGTGAQRELTLAQVESRTIEKQSMMPDGLVNNLTPEGLADLIAYLQQLTGGGDPPKAQR